MKKMQEYILKIIRSNLTKYLFMFILVSVVIMNVITIVVCIINYASTGNSGFLDGVTNFAILISISITLIIYLIRNLD